MIDFGYTNFKMAVIQNAGKRQFKLNIRLKEIESYRPGIHVGKLRTCVIANLKMALF